MPRLTTYALLGLLLVPAIGWATFRQIRESEAWDLVHAAATAHERVGYRATLAPPSSSRTRKFSRGWGPRRLSSSVEHDAQSGNTTYQFGGFNFTLKGPGRRSDPAGWCLDYDLVKRNYRPRVRGTSRFLERPVRILELEPTRAGRPLVQLTLDEETLLPLRVVTLSADGKPISTRAFRTVDIGMRTVAPGRGRPGNVVAPEALSEAVGFAVLTPAYLPAGFRRLESRMSPWAGVKATLYYTDGITAFEIRQSEVQTPAAIESALAKRMGKRGAERFMQRILEQRMRVLAENDEESDGIAVRRRKFGSFVSFELRVDQVDVHLSGRAGLDADEMLRVLRSLR